MLNIGQTLFLTSSEDVTLMRVIDCQYSGAVSHNNLREGAEFLLKQEINYSRDDTREEHGVSTSKVILSPVFKGESIFEFDEKIDVFVNVEYKHDKSTGLIRITRGTLFIDKILAKSFADKFYKMNESYIAKHYPKFLKQ